jgi:hypothetical protein
MHKLCPGSLETMKFRGQFSVYSVGEKGATSPHLFAVRLKGPSFPCRTMPRLSWWRRIPEKEPTPPTNASSMHHAFCIKQLEIFFLT